MYLLFLTGFQSVSDADRGCDTDRADPGNLKYDGLNPLLCLQTLVEYGSNVTVQNQQGERPSQSAERQGHTTCARYLVVVETCMSLASQVVKLTKQLNE